MCIECLNFKANLFSVRQESTFVIEVAGRRGRGRPNMTWKRQVAERTNQIWTQKEGYH